MAIDQIGTAGIATGAITTAAIANGSVVPADLSTGAPYWDTSGNVGIGTTSPTISGSTALTLNLKNPSTNSAALITAQSNDGGSSVQLWSGLNNTDNPAITFQRSLRFGTTTDAGVGGFTERARIDTSGNLLVGTTSAGGKVSINSIGGSSGTSLFINGWGSGIGSAAQFTAANTSNADVMYFNTSAANVGKIAITSTATSYVTSSDYRLKENVQPMTGALAKVAALKPCTYTWKTDNSNGEGFIAHELAEVVPGCVTGEKDAVDADGNPIYQGIDTSFLVATLTAAIQEQQAMIEELRAEVTALKGAA